MNELLQKHGCSNVFTIPEGLKELMSDITREVLREQPPKIFDFIANYLSALMITREHGVMSLKILDDLCDCKPSICDHLIAHNIPKDQAEAIAVIIQQQIEQFTPVVGQETIREAEIMKKVLTKFTFDEDTVAVICQITRNAYRDYWYRKKLLEARLKTKPNEPWEVAAEHTLEIYKKTKPSFAELERATVKITAAYRGYHVRRNLLQHLKPMTKQHKPKVNLQGPPLDVAGSRDVRLGPLVQLRLDEDDVPALFDEVTKQNLQLKYDPNKTITHVVEDDDILESKMFPEMRRLSKSVAVVDAKQHGAAPAKKITEINENLDQTESFDRTKHLPSMPKISFSLHQTEVIDYDDEVDDEIKVASELDVEEDIEMTAELDEVEDEVPETIEANEMTETMSEVPEDVVSEFEAADEG